MSGELYSSIDTLVTDFRHCSRFPALGLCKLAYGDCRKDLVDEFLVRLSKLISEKGICWKESSEGIDSVQGSGVAWKRWRVSNVFPFYMESLSVQKDVSVPEGETLPITQGFPGQWFIGEQVFEESHPDYFAKNLSAWTLWISQKIEGGQNLGGLSCNIMDVPATHLADNTVDVRPLTLHALAPDGRGVDRGDINAQAAIANAFWQTFWATGATRSERGSVFPVAFFPVDRGSAYEFQAPFHERYVSLRRRLFGRSAIVGYALEALTKHKGLVFEHTSSRFLVSMDFDPLKAEVGSADVLLAVEELNRTGFVDAYTGTNKSLFQGWIEQEETLDMGEPWPYDGDKKIKASGHGAEDVLQRVRAVGDSSTYSVINRVVPFAGCAYLYQVMLEMDQLKRRGKVQDFDGELIGATNSTFFLNFPEEYASLHSAMNEPVSLLVESGITRQIKTLKRAAFILSGNGEAFITSRTGNRLNSEVLVFEGESSSATYMDKAHQSFKENTFGPLFFGASVVGNSIVETFEEIAAEVPPAGWLIGDSEAFGGKIDPVNAAEVLVRRDGELKEIPVRHGFAIGPLLLNKGNIVPLEESCEDFVSIQLNKPMTFEETSSLSRTELPDALLNCTARGVPPTRFPYDWDETRAPRTGIGVREDGSVVVAVVDGRADLPHSVGATLAELAVIMKAQGCTDAMNMDGGGSSVMFINSPEAVHAKLREDLRDGIVSLPSDMGGVERLLPVPLVICRTRQVNS